MCSEKLVKLDRLPWKVAIYNIADALFGPEWNGIQSNLLIAETPVFRHVWTVQNSLDIHVALAQDCPHLLIGSTTQHYNTTSISLISRPIWKIGKRTWYPLFAHALNFSTFQEFQIIPWYLRVPCCCIFIHTLVDNGYLWILPCCIPYCDLEAKWQR